MWENQPTVTQDIFNHKNISITAQKDIYEFLGLYFIFFLQIFDEFLHLSLEGIQILKSTLLFG